MATINTTITSTAFVEISTAADALVQNISTTPVLIRFDTSLPAVGDDAMVLTTGNAIQKIAGKPVGNIYARMAFDDKVSKVSVAE